MALSLRREHMKRYRDIARLFMRYGRAGAIRRARGGAMLRRKSDGEEVVVAEGKAFAADLERMGPTFVKLGQLLSTRAELFPVAYMKALARLQDDVEPFPFAEVERVLVEELGVGMDRIFRDFQRVPMAAASLGQVHAAVLHDGKHVAVKVQRPGIRETMARDLEALDHLARMLDKRTKVGKKYEFGKIVDDFRRSLVRELDYLQEARNLEILGGRMQRFDRIVVPGTVGAYTTSRVLTMDRVFGKKVTSLDAVTSLELDGDVLGDQLFRAYLEQTLVDGFFHADPHPGNVFLTTDKNLALIDLGMVGRIDPRLRQNLLSLLLAISEGRGAEAAEEALKIGESRKDFREHEFRRRVMIQVNEEQGRRMQDLQMGRIMMEITSISVDCGVRVPSELTLLGKTLMNLDEVGRALDPNFDPNAAVRRHAAQIMNRQVWKGFSPGHLLGGILETKEMAERFPYSMNRILDILSHNRTRVRIDAIDEEYLMEGFQKIANRITMGVVLAGILVGASLLARIETDFQLFGFPGLAILFFLAAALGGIALMLDILLRDKRHHKKEPDRRD